MTKSSAPFHLSGPELETWRLLARGALSIISLTHRASGFWAYPPIKEEVDQYYKGSNEMAFSSTEYGSYTVTWIALLALQHLSIKCPTCYLNKVEHGFYNNPAIGGARGRPLGGRTKAKAVDASARHTAFASLTLSQFRPEHQRVDLLASVRWLLKNQNPSTHGWKYRPTDSEDEAFSTAACIAALAVFMSRYASILPSETIGASNPEIHKSNQEMVGAIKIAIANGLQRLFDMKSKEGLWKGHLNEPNDLIGTANIIDLISSPEVGEAIPLVNRIDLTAKIADVKAALIMLRRHYGWPINYDSPEPSISATIHVLFTLYDTLLNDKNDVTHLNLRGIAKYIAEETTEKGGALRLDSWDWPMLGRLCATLLSTTEGRILSESEVSQSLAAIEILKRSGSRVVQLCVLSHYAFLKPWYPTILFVLSKGQPLWWHRAFLTFFGFAKFLPMLKKLLEKYVEKAIEHQLGIT